MPDDRYSQVRRLYPWVRGTIPSVDDLYICRALAGIQTDPHFYGPEDFKEQVEEAIKQAWEFAKMDDPPDGWG